MKGDAVNFRLPKLEWFMTQKRCSFFLLACHIENIQVVYTNIDGLVATNEFFEWSSWVVTSQNLHVYVTDIEIVIDHNHELKFLWSITSKFDQEEANFPMASITEKINFLHFRVVADIKNQLDIK